MKRLCVLQTFIVTILFISNVFSQNFWQESYTGNFYTSSLDVSTEGNVFATEDNSLIRSLDNGLTWQTIYTATTPGTFNTFGASPTGIVYFNSDSMRKSTDEGNIWITSNLPLGGSFIPLWFLISNNDGDIFTETGILSGSYSFRTIDEANSWTQIGVSQALLQSISFHSNGFTYAVYQGNLPPGNNLYKSSDKGDNWQNIPGVPSLLHIVYVAKNGQIYVGSNTTLYKTTDDGLNWTSLLSQNVIDIAENQLGHLFVATESAGVFKSMDDGTNWQQINSGLAFLSTTKLTVDSLGYLYVITGQDQFTQTKLYRSVESTIPVELVSFSADVINDKVHLNWVTASETNNYGFEIHRSTQNNNEWATIGFVPGFGTTTEIHSYSFTDSDVQTGKYNYRLKQLDYDGSFTYSEIVEADVYPIYDFILEQNYPNPFNPSTRIKYQISSISEVILKVYDILGKEIAILVNEEKPAGTYEVEFDASEILSGVYFYTIQAGTFTQTSKMVLIK